MYFSVVLEMSAAKVEWRRGKESEKGKRGKEKRKEGGERERKKKTKERLKV